MKDLLGRLLAGVLVFGSLSAYGLEVGDAAPEATSTDENGEAWALKDYAGKNAVVVYFYPKDDTYGCTKEACAFRDAYQDFTDVGAEVVGISSDTAASHEHFAQKNRLPFVLLADTEGTARKAFKVPNTLFFIQGRATFVINPEGKVAHAFNSQLNFSKHVDEALRIIRQ